jgi:hypothetical protein
MMHERRQRQLRRCGSHHGSVAVGGAFARTRLNAFTRTPLCGICTRCARGVIRGLSLSPLPAALFACLRSLRCCFTSVTAARASGRGRSPRPARPRSYAAAQAQRKRSSISGGKQPRGGCEAMMVRLSSFAPRRAARRRATSPRGAARGKRQARARAVPARAWAALSAPRRLKLPRAPSVAVSRRLLPPRCASPSARVR